MTGIIGRTTELFVDGMSCGHCVASVREELHEVGDIKNVEVILVKDGTSKVLVVSDAPLNDDALRDAIHKAGFNLKHIRHDL